MFMIQMKSSAIHKTLKLKFNYVNPLGIWGFFKFDTSYSKTKNLDMKYVTLT